MASQEHSKAWRYHPYADPSVSVPGSVSSCCILIILYCERMLNLSAVKWGVEGKKVKCEILCNVLLKLLPILNKST